MISTLQGCLAAETTDAHEHGEHQLLLPTQGLMLFEDASHRYVLSGRHAAFIPKGHPHTAQTMSATGKVHFLSMYFSDEDFQSAADTSPTALSTEIVVFHCDNLLFSCFQRCCQTRTDSDLVWQSEPHKTLLRLALLLSVEAMREPTELVLPSTSHPTLKPILSYLEECFRGPVQLADVARQFAMSTRTIQRLFQRESGFHFSEYLRLLRVFHATLLLSTTRLSIIEIAYEVGYESLSAFYVAFRTITGQTPGESRRYHKGLQSSQE